MWTSIPFLHGLVIALAAIVLLFGAALGFVAFIAFASEDDGVDLIGRERGEHYTREGWTDVGDAGYIWGELAMAAACYALPDSWRYGSDKQQVAGVPDMWPWSGQWWKPKDRKADLIRAGALIAAELDRMIAAEKRAKARADIFVDTELQL